MLILGILIGLIVLVVLVVIHELGHAIVAKRNGVVVEEFGIGFPPRAWSKKLKNGVLFTLNWLPLGGFVKLQGENDAATGKGDYGAATFWQKTKILFAGVVMNWLVAVVLLTILAWTGLPKIIENQVTIPGDTRITTSAVQVGSVVADYPAAQAGLESGDAIIYMDNEMITSPAVLIDITKQNRGETIPVVYRRDGEERTVDVSLRDADTSVFGATLGQQEKIYATWSAPLVGIATTGQMTWVTLQGVGQLVVDFFGGLALQLAPNQEVRQQGSEQLDRATNSVSGPVGLVGVIFPAASEAGPTQIVFLAAIISLTLAVMNTLPIPALDGGRWFTTAIFKLLRKPLTKDREERIQGTGFLIMMGLFLLITIGDVTKLFN